MKSLNFFVLLIVTITTSACASQADVVTEQSATLNPTSSSAHAVAHSPATTLDNSYLSRVLNGTRYIAGFSIDNSGINTPIISTEGNDGKSSFHYPNEIVTDFLTTTTRPWPYCLAEKHYYLKTINGFLAT